MGWKLGSLLGTVVQVEQFHVYGEQGRIIKCLIQWDLQRKLRKSITAKGVFEETYIVKLQYEKLPTYCFFCGIIGHDERNCIAKIKLEMCGSDFPLQFDNTLRAQQNGCEDNAHGQRQMTTESSTLTEGVVHQPESIWHRLSELTVTEHRANTCQNTYAQGQSPQ
ncbi:Zinc CCHC-type-like protein [Quillaja saponaria]|uniref:Zinc CCHC-type-like protein n=1 Tax=Quillaja saponaria TaxID=32244 RepID=A0AAD7KMN0_QUISA|nr:Zinc CCHC-type-like protein [Quillaja saponaria]